MDDNSKKEKELWCLLGVFSVMGENEVNEADEQQWLSGVRLESEWISTLGALWN